MNDRVAETALESCRNLYTKIMILKESGRFELCHFQEILVASKSLIDIIDNANLQGDRNREIILTNPELMHLRTFRPKGPRPIIKRKSKVGADVQRECVNCKTTSSCEWRGGPSGRCLLNSRTSDVV